jgi:hypothetical protein
MAADSARREANPTSALLLQCIEKPKTGAIPPWPGQAASLSPSSAADRLAACPNEKKNLLLSVYTSSPFPE